MLSCGHEGPDTEDVRDVDMSSRIKGRRRMIRRNRTDQFRLVLHPPIERGVDRKLVFADS